jgi:hypothetical protein
MAIRLYMHVCFQTYVVSVLSRCCIFYKWLCCKCMFRMFHLFQIYVAIVQLCLSDYLSVAKVDLNIGVEEA